METFANAVIAFFLLFVIFAIMGWGMLLDEKIHFIDKLDKIFKQFED